MDDIKVSLDYTIVTGMPTQQSDPIDNEGRFIFEDKLHSFESFCRFVGDLTIVGAAVMKRIDGDGVAAAIPVGLIEILEGAV